MTPTDRQSQSDASTAREAQRRIEERDRPFWEDVLIASLAGAAVPVKAFPEEYAVQRAVELADFALTARNARGPGGEDSDGPSKSQARRVGKECVGTCSSRWAPNN